MISDIHIYMVRNFPGSPVTKTPYLHSDGWGSVPGQGTKISHAK